MKEEETFSKESVRLSALDKQQLTQYLRNSDMLEGEGRRVAN